MAGAVLIVALVIVTALYVRRRLTHPYSEDDVDGARAQSRVLSRSSRDGIRGENVAPWLPGFPYEPRDAAFLGKPVDYVVFAGLDAASSRRSFSSRSSAGGRG